MNKSMSLMIVALALIAAGVVGLAFRNTEEVDPEPTNTNEQVGSTQPAGQTQSYDVVFDVPWSENTHLSTLPPGPHMSPMIAVVHKSVDGIFAFGDRATEGFEIVAETGSPTTFTAELDELIASGEVKEYAVGSRIDAPGTDDVTIEASQEFPYLTVVSMVAPSPDWIVAVHNFELFQQGQWVSSLPETIAIDAGTDDGRSFTSPNSDNSTGVISGPIDAGFSAALEEGPLGIFLVRQTN